MGFGFIGSVRARTTSRPFVRTDGSTRGGKLCGCGLLGRPWSADGCSGVSNDMPCVVRSLVHSSWERPGWSVLVYMGTFCTRLPSLASAHSLYSQNENWESARMRCRAEFAEPWAKVKKGENQPSLVDVAMA